MIEIHIGAGENVERKFDEAFKKINITDKKMGDYSNELTIEYSKRLKKLVEMRMMNTFFTGQMRETVKIENVTLGPRKSSVTISTAAPYAIPQETGFAPHFVPASAITRSGRTFGDWIREKYMIGKAGKQPGGLVVKKPFRETGYYFGPAVLDSIKYFPSIENKVFTKHFKGR